MKDISFLPTCLSENDILVIVILVLVLRLEEFLVCFLLVDFFALFLLLLLGCDLGFFNLFCFELLVLYALKSIEIFSVKLIQLRINPLDDVIDTWEDDKLKCIYTSVC